MIIGLTGLVGSGKSLAADYFSRLGIDIIDTDRISHNLTGKNGAASLEIAKTFGAEYLTHENELDRSRMRDLVFRDVDSKRKLEGILHPLIFAEVIKQTNQTQSIYTVIVVPLLFSSPGYIEFIDRSIFVDCDEEISIERVIKRNGLSRQAVLDILHNQMPRQEQLKRADDIIVNNTTALDLELQIKKLHSKYEIIIHGSKNV